MVCSGCASLELGNSRGPVFLTCSKSESHIYHDLYCETSVWEWQAFGDSIRVALGDFEGVKSRMDEVYRSVPERYSQRLTIELTQALIEQKEVLLAWDIIQPRLEQNAVSMVPVILNICEFYAHQEGKAGAFKWMLSLSSNYGHLLRSYAFCDALYQLATAVGDRKSVHDICGYLWS